MEQGVSKEDIERLRAANVRLAEALERKNGNSQVGTSNIHINAGGIGVLIVTALASFMCALCICMAFFMFHQEKVLEDMHDYLSVIYQYAPNLKPKDFK